MTFTVSSICPANSAGVSERPALYSPYSSERNVGPERSNATATCVGRCWRIMVSSMAVKPYTALVCWPVSVAKFSAGSA